MILAIFLLAVIIAACALLYLQQRKTNEQIENVRQDIIAEMMDYHQPLEEDEEYWQLLRHDTATELLRSYFGVNDSGLPDEKQLAETILRYTDELISRLKEDKPWYLQS